MEIAEWKTLAHASMPFSILAEVPPPLTNDTRRGSKWIPVSRLYYYLLKSARTSLLLSRHSLSSTDFSQILSLLGGKIN